MENTMTAIYKRRRSDFATWLAQQGTGAMIFIDSEEHRSPSIRYFTGHPQDAVFCITVDGSSVLIPWDEILATKIADADYIIPYTRYERQAVKAAAGALRKLKVPANSRVEIPSFTSYPAFLKFVDGLTEFDVICRENGGEEAATRMRSIKDEYEISCIEKAAEITDKLIDTIEAGVKDGTIKTESDAALLIERECRAAGCEGTGFDTLAAGPARSFGIHCFPNYTAGEFPAQGLSILDFGVIYKGYTSDVTITIAKGPLSEGQEKQLALVEKAYNECLKLYEKDVPVKAASQKADEIFAKAKRTMPHSLGHGVGLECHEAPGIRLSAPQEVVFKPGMLVTLEPGLYDEKLGGCRLENDILITEDGNRVLTHARIIRI
ncbi:MAG: Xaa-Pro peptidase family protein [Treponemataceae bacterium]|nr:Xaa-Pro peptidase family protein [Treponemataceae bacterium]